MYNAGFREVSVRPIRRFDYNTGGVIANLGQLAAFLDDLRLD
jgi:hypothetical protein